MVAGFHHLSASAGAIGVPMVRRVILSFLAATVCVVAAILFHGGDGFATAATSVSCLGFGGCWVVVVIEHGDTGGYRQILPGAEFSHLLVVTSVATLGLLAAWSAAGKACRRSSKSCARVRH